MSRDTLVHHVQSTSRSSSSSEMIFRGRIAIGLSCAGSAGREGSSVRSAADGEAPSSGRASSISVGADTIRCRSRWGRSSTRRGSPCASGSAIFFLARHKRGSRRCSSKRARKSAAIRRRGRSCTSCARRSGAGRARCSAGSSRPTRPSRPTWADPDLACEAGRAANKSIVAVAVERRAHTAGSLRLHIVPDASWRNLGPFLRGGIDSDEATRRLEGLRPAGRRRGVSRADPADRACARRRNLALGTRRDLEPRDLAARDLPRCQSRASPTRPRRVHLPLQSPLA